jgi:hypothetical protein
MQNKTAFTTFPARIVFEVGGSGVSVPVPAMEKGKENLDQNEKLVDLQESVESQFKIDFEAEAELQRQQKELEKKMKLIGGLDESEVIRKTGEVRKLIEESLQSGLIKPEINPLTGDLRSVQVMRLIQNIFNNLNDHVFNNLSESESPQEFADVRAIYEIIEKFIADIPEQTQLEVYKKLGLTREMRLHEDGSGVVPGSEKLAEANRSEQDRLRQKRRQVDSIPYIDLWGAKEKIDAAEPEKAPTKLEDFLNQKLTDFGKINIPRYKSELKQRVKRFTGEMVKHFEEKKIPFSQDKITSLLDKLK